jgi:hypothetical protein
MGAPRFEGVGGVSMAHLVRGNRQIDADTFFRATAHLVFSEKWRGIKYLGPRNGRLGLDRLTRHESAGPRPSSGNGSPCGAAGRDADGTTCTNTVDSSRPYSWDCCRRGLW